MLRGTAAIAHSATRHSGTLQYRSALVLYPNGRFAGCRAYINSYQSLYISTPLCGNFELEIPIGMRIMATNLYFHKASLFNGEHLVAISNNVSCAFGYLEKWNIANSYFGAYSLKTTYMYPPWLGQGCHPARHVDCVAEKTKPGANQRSIEGSALVSLFSLSFLSLFFALYIYSHLTILVKFWFLKNFE